MDMAGVFFSFELLDIRGLGRAVFQLCRDQSGPVESFRDFRIEYDQYIFILYLPHPNFILINLQRVDM